MEVKVHINNEDIILTEETPLYEIAGLINRDWDNVSPHAKAYLDPMYSLESIEDKYMFDDARSIVLYFLSNARQWKGENAREIKRLLKEISTRR